MSSLTGDLAAVAMEKLHADYHENMCDCPALSLSIAQAIAERLEQVAWAEPNVPFQGKRIRGFMPGVTWEQDEGWEPVYRLRPEAGRG